jgi:hypothetical protein
MGKITRGLTAGAIGAIILAAVMFVMFLANVGKVPGFVGIYRKMNGENVPIDYILGTIGFVAAGSIWGMIYTLFVKKPSVITGMLYGFVPTLFLWLVISPLMSGAIFNGFAAKGIVFPVIFNVLVWGGFTGWFLSRKAEDIV